MDKSVYGFSNNQISDEYDLRTVFLAVLPTWLSRWQCWCVSRSVRLNYLNIRLIVMKCGIAIHDAQRMNHNNFG